MKIVESSYKLESYFLNPVVYKTLIKKFPIQFIDIGKQEDFRWNNEDTLVFAIDFGTMKAEDIKNWSQFIFDGKCDEIMIKKLKNYHSFTYWVRMWWD